MNTSSILPPPDTPWILSKRVLDEAGSTGHLHLLAPGAEYVPDAASPGDTLLFVISSAITASVGPSNHILAPETTLRIAPEKAYTLRNATAALAKVLVLALPPPPAPQPPPIITLRG